MYVLLLRLTALQNLDLNYTRVVSNLEALKGLTGLQRLDLSGTKVSNLEPLKGLTALKMLNLSGTQVSDLEPVYDLPNLRESTILGMFEDIRTRFVTYRTKKLLPY
jgi:internalin A